MSRLSRTNIEYGDYGWNFCPGCLHKEQGICPVGETCWARAMSKRQKEDFSKPHLIPELLLAPLSIKKPSVILVNFMGDLGGSWVDPEQKTSWVKDTWKGNETLREVTFSVINACHRHTFLFLSKNPAAWPKWNPWPDNAWVGVTVCNQKMYNEALSCLDAVQAKHKWLSIEPLFERIIMQPPYDFEGANIDWLVIGGQTRPTVMPEISWVREIVEACDGAGVRVWLKDNLRPLIPEHRQLFLTKPHPEGIELLPTLRQERPW